MAPHCWLLLPHSWVCNTVQHDLQLHLLQARVLAAEVHGAHEQGGATTKAGF